MKTKPVVASASAIPAARRWRAIGTTVSILTTDPARIDLAADLLRIEVETLDFVCSRFRADSELSGVHRAGGEVTSISPYLADLVAVALDVAVLTDGRVDPTVGSSLVALGYDRDFAALERSGPGTSMGADQAPGWRCIELDRARGTLRLPADVLLDLGSSGKAYCADQAAQRIAAAVDCGVLVNLGGDIAVAGESLAGGWLVGIDADSAAAPESAGTVVAVDGGGMASSGTAARRWRRGGRDWHHIVDPRTGYSADTPWLLVTVAAGTCTIANAASTSAIVDGRSGLERLLAIGLPARLVGDDGSVVTTGGWPPEHSPQTAVMSPRTTPAPAFPVDLAI